MHRRGRCCRRLQVCVSWIQRTKDRGVEEGAKEAESLGETAGWQQLDPGSSLVCGRECLSYESCCPGSPSLELGKGLRPPLHVRRCGWGPWGLRALVGWAQGFPDAWVLFPSGAGGVQERVSVHPHRLHPSFDFGHQLQTPQPRYLARALTGESVGPLGKGERRVLPDPCRVCFHASMTQEF